ncbi:hypothetical protein B0H17DRAFT_186291 [Mycena rosella]|uniref:Uncharacterized protein n=1 Tax=Mycena rosella TaxID=1033263 RepID=A0AAD7DZ98_MYCRO|nr:hypothetical protein B0H17DRAFT_186291 [Mycena rosella]
MEDRNTGRASLCATRHYVFARPTAQPSSRSRSAAASALRPMLRLRRRKPPCAARVCVFLPAETVKGRHPRMRTARGLPWRGAERIRCRRREQRAPSRRYAATPTQTALYLRTSALSLHATPVCPTTSGPGRTSRSALQTAHAQLLSRGSGRAILQRKCTNTASHAACAGTPTTLRVVMRVQPVAGVRSALYAPAPIPCSGGSLFGSGACARPCRRAARLQRRRTHGPRDAPALMCTRRKAWCRQAVIRLRRVCKRKLKQNMTPREWGNRTARRAVVQNKHKVCEINRSSNDEGCD